MARPYSGTSTYDPNAKIILREVATIRGGAGLPAYVNEEQVKLPDGGAKIARLTCTCSNYQRRLAGPWCKHVEEIVNQEYDGRHEDDHTTKVELPPHVDVPIFGKPWLSMPCVLSRSPDIESARGVSVNGEHIGFIFVGQGRKSIRTLVIDWLVEKSATLPACRADHHYRPLPWEREPFNPRHKHHLTNLADLILTGQCRPCNEDDGVPDV